MRLIVGLGNPGAAYAGTRHNVGFEVVDKLAARFGTDVKRKKFGSLTGEFAAGGGKVVLLKPQEFMNRSGQAVATAVGFYKVPLQDVMVVTDDLALEPGRIRMRPSGSAGGHNGLKDIILRLGSEDFGRLRVGVGGPGGGNTKDYVLSRPARDEREAIESAIAAAVEALSCWLQEGIDAAMSKYNVRKSEND
ncbi:MAG: aminoacyl-tRNA hydrolase [Phycisphaerae bacterium]|nr:aminoacyl-tRNA hydrolase [Phycisphaerae bacterium]